MQKDYEGMPLTHIGKRLIKYGMIGGGPGGFSGGVHRKAAALDGEIELVCGAFSSKPEKSVQMGESLCLNSGRVYKSYKDMAEKEAELPEDKRIDFVSIVTPNYLHFPVAKEFIMRGFDIVCDKPMVTNLKEAKELLELVEKNDVLFAVTYNYTGYPMIRQARELIKEGKIGEILKVIIEYSACYIPVNAEINSLKKIYWRVDPAKAGPSSCMGDLGSHAENLSNYVTGLEVEQVFADLKSFVTGCELENDANVLIHYKNGARGVMLLSQVLTGEDNNLSIRVYGSKASLLWFHNNPNVLSVRYMNKPEQIFKLGGEYLEPLTRYSTRLTSGHPEGYIEAFANIYRNFARTVRAKKYNEKIESFENDFPTIEDGFKGMYFIDKALESYKTTKWVKFNNEVL
jgi:predicted dehydrogenase